MMLTSRCPRCAARRSLPASYLLALLLAWIPVGVAQAFGLEEVSIKAAALATQPYRPPEKIPKFLREIDYDALRDIRYKPEFTLWRAPGMHFDVQFFHPGMVYEHAVKLHYLDREGVHEVPFSVERFDYGPRARHLRHRIPPDLGYAGFRIYYPLNDPGVQDEVIAFLGASYFRAVPKGGRYGLSARGLAIDTALEGGEEFPEFREFWIERPRKDSRYIRIYALLDSPSVTGAYRFTVFPGDPTRVYVKLRLYPRKKIRELGIAPLTSMFFYGENTPRPAGQWRPEVHDSDGLMLIDGTGERIWRPLVNGPRLRLALFGLKDPRGF
ncbi:MAG TPA: glucan biosynthesis protein G, partial [Chromatiales bacterium]|nr:glucan biosynthesis protein G [Chromatiales bacterium]